MVPATDFRQSLTSRRLHFKAVGWQESQGILKFLQPGDGYIFTSFTRPKAPKTEVYASLFICSGCFFADLRTSVHYTFAFGRPQLESAVGLNRPGQNVWEKFMPTRRCFWGLNHRPWRLEAEVRHYRKLRALHDKRILRKDTHSALKARNLPGTYSRCDRTQVARCCCR